MKYGKAFRFVFLCLAVSTLLTASRATFALNVTPKLIAFKQLNANSFEVVTSWTIGEVPPAGYVVFVHLTSPTPTDNGDILLQPDPGLPTPDHWKAGSTLVSKAVVVTMPANVKDGTYKYRVGMFSPTGNDRLTLNGSDDDGDNRYTLAPIVVSNGGTTFASPGVPTVTPVQEGLVDAAPSLVDFQQTGPRNFQFQISFDVKSAIPAGEVVFAHLTILNPDATHDEILPSGPGPDSDPSSWPVGQKHVTPVVPMPLPDGLADGTYSIRVGMYAQAGDGSRLKFVGTDDGEGRYVIGTVVVSGGGAKIVLGS